MLCRAKNDKALLNVQESLVKDMRGWEDQFNFDSNSSWGN